MSSQGPATQPTVSPITGIPKGYKWDKLTIRDSSDWTTYKKQTLIASFDAAKIATSTDPWFVHGEGYKLEYLNGRNKCDKCEAGTFVIEEPLSKPS